MRTTLLLLGTLLSPTLLSADVWLFLKDGRIGLGDPAKSPVQLALTDGTSAEITVDQIHSKRTQEETNTAIDGMMQDILRGKNIVEHTQRLQSYRAAGAPRLLTYLKNADARLRLSALYAFQFCYAPAAKEPILAALNDTDSDVRKTAFAALARHVPEVELAGLLQATAVGSDVALSALVFEMVDKHHPDPSLKRIKRLLADPKHHTAILTRLSHYRDPSLTPLTLPLLDSPNKDVARTAVVALITQLANDDATRAKVRGLLGSTDPDTRDIAAEYFAWLGQKSDLDALQRAVTKEIDPYVKASLEASIAIIPRRDQLWSKDSATSSIFASLRAHALEPTLIYGLVDTPEKDAARDRHFQLQKTLAIPCGDLRESVTNLITAKQEPAAARMPPVREFFDDKRKSFGLEMPSKGGVFSGSVHVGDDVAWRKEMRTVVAVAPGLVRSVEHAYSWGFIVIVEHQLNDEKSFCSLYAHLSPMIHVKPGDTVKLGQKIGSTGRNQCVENGGYMSHLHFGLHDGPFASKGGSWVCGYIGLERWKSGEHGWLEPQAFLKSK